GAGARRGRGGGGSNTPKRCPPPPQRGGQPKKKQPPQDSAMATKIKKWRTAPLSRLVRFASGGTPSRVDPRFWNGDIPWLSAKDMKKFRLDDSIEKVTREGANNGTRLIEAGSVLIL